MKLWIYTEERPRFDTLLKIVQRFARDRNLEVSETGEAKIIPVFDNGLFTFVYRIQGITCTEVDEILVETISGSSSFVDYVVFYQDEKPTNKNTPLYIIEETKTDDQESRNTGVYQRSSKFVYSEFFYPDVPKVMMYNLKVEQKETPTLTYIFGTKMLLTLGVQIEGKTLDPEVFKHFETIDEFIEEKNAMPNPHYGVPVKFAKRDGVIEISAKLEKGGRLSHDPNIGMTTIMAACLRKLGWEGRIVITRHGLPNQRSVGRNNKFILIANQIGIELDGLDVPNASLPDQYWHSEVNQEKIGTIFTSILCEGYADGVAIYENHGGCERGYFISVQNGDYEYIAIPKYSDREKYKAGDKTYIIYIPDVVIYDRANNIVINGEGKTFANKEKGIEELQNFDFFEENHVRVHYPDSEITRTLILYGGESKTIEDKEVGLLLTSNGKVLLGENAPVIFKQALQNLLGS